MVSGLAPTAGYKRSGRVSRMSFAPRSFSRSTAAIAPRRDDRLRAGLLRRLGGLRPKDARGYSKAAGCTVGHLDLILPRQSERAGDHVLHEGVGAIHRAALHRHVSAVPKLIDVVL